MKLVFIGLLMFFACSVSAETCSSLKSVHWLLGSWVSNNEKMTMTERWSQISDETIEGKGETYASAKLKSSESLRLVSMMNQVFYIAKVSHNPRPVAFTLTTCSENHAVFENDKHDFPKRIEYSRTNESAMRVFVSDGKDKGFTLVFYAVKAAR